MPAMSHLSTLRPSDVPGHCTGGELFYAGVSRDECVTEMQRRQWDRAMWTEIDAACECDPYAPGGWKDAPGYSECRERELR